MSKLKVRAYTIEAEDRHTGEIVELIVNAYTGKEALQKVRHGHAPILQNLQIVAMADLYPDE